MDASVSTYQVVILDDHATIAAGIGALVDAIQDQMCCNVCVGHTTVSCKSVYVPLGDKRKTGLRIVNLPELMRRSTCLLIF